MEIFGYDFMICGDLKPWLIEVNTNPCLEESSSLLKQLVPRMLDDAFKLTLDLLFPQFTKGSCTVGTDSAFRVDGYPDSDNMWGESFYNLRPIK